MIAKIVAIQLPVDMTREQVLAEAKNIAPNWQSNPDLIRKYFLLDENNRTLGFYIWKNKEAADKAHGTEFLARVKDTFGCVPEISYLDLFMDVDNETGKVTEYLE